jgi:hypothetical protein
VDYKLGWVDAVKIGLRRPIVALRRVQMFIADPGFRRKRMQWLSYLTDTPEQDIAGFINEIEGDKAFLTQVRSAYRRNTVYFPLPTDFMVQGNAGSTIFFHVVSLYVLVRLVRPRIVVETGGTPGKSSAFILRAMHRNEIGELYTIDLPPEPTNRLDLSPVEGHSGLSPGLTANWCVPDSLRDRHHLLLGRAQDHLPSLLDQLQEIDIFIHDSDHSYEHMSWELRTAYPFVRDSGYLWADDIGTNDAWLDFCNEAGVSPEDFTSQGVIHKPTVGID